MPLNPEEVKHLVSHCQFLTVVKVPSALDFHLLVPYNFQQLSPPVFCHNFRAMALQLFYLLYVCKKMAVVPRTYANPILYHSLREELWLVLEDFHREQEITMSDQGTRLDMYNTFLESLGVIWAKVDEKEKTREVLSCSHFRLQVSNATNSNAYDELAAFHEMQKCDLFVQTSVLTALRNTMLLFKLQRILTLKESLNKAIANEAELLQDKKINAEMGGDNQSLLMEASLYRNLEQFMTSLKQPCADVSKLPDAMYASAPNVKKQRFLLKLYEERQNPLNGEIKMGPKSEIQIEYNSSHSQKVHFNVRLLSDLLFDFSTCDPIQMKWSALTCTGVQLTLESHDRQDETKQFKKCVAWKASCSISASQSLLRSMITLIDICVASFRAALIDLRAEGIHLLTQLRLDDFDRKLNHYVRIVHKACSAIYSRLGTQQ